MMLSIVAGDQSNGCGSVYNRLQLLLNLIWWSLLAELSDSIVCLLTGVRAIE